MQQEPKQKCRLWTASNEITGRLKWFVALGSPLVHQTLLSCSTQPKQSHPQNKAVCVCGVCVCIPILVTTFPEWLSGRQRRRSVTLQSPTATLIPLFSSSELTGCGYPGLLDRKNRSDMCSRWESNLRLPACKASTLSTRPGSPY